MRRIPRLMWFLGLFALVLAACGGQPEPEPTPEQTEPESAPESTVAEAAPEPTQAPPPADQADVINIAWQWADLVETSPAAQSVVPNSENYVVVFREGGMVNIQADCNVVQGSYTLDGNALRIMMGPTTAAFCGEESLDTQFLALLNTVNNGTLEDGRLFLHTSEAARMGFNNGGMADVVESEVTGTITYMVRSALPDDAKVTVQLQDTSLADAPAVVLGQDSFVTEGAQVPFPFAVSYDPSQILENHDYTLSVRITDGQDNLLFINDTVIPVITKGNPTSGIEAMVVSVGGAAASQVTGTVFYRERLALPDNAMLSVQIQDTSLADALATVIGEMSYETNGAQVPLPFAVSYNSADIQENHDYTLSARITDADGNLMFINDMAIPVISKGNPTEDVEVPVVATGGDAAVPESDMLSQIVGKTWFWKSFSDPAVGGQDIAEPERYQMVLNDDGTVSVQADCNMVQGTYTVDGSSIMFEFGATTLVSCPPDSLGDQFVQNLAAARIMFMQDGDLFFDLFADSGTMRFSETGTSEEDLMARLIGPVWAWTDWRAANVTTAVPDPQRYTIQFNEDGTATIAADCNNILAEYTVEGNSMTLALGPTTQVFCGEDSLDTQFVQGLTAVDSFGFRNDQLQLESESADQTLWFAAGAGSGEAELLEMLVGPVWEWTDWRAANTTTAVPDPQRYRIQFLLAGVANIAADCNNILAEYTVDGNLITLALGPTTQVFCGEDSLDTEYVQALSTIESFTFADEQLLLESASADLTMWFQSGGAQVAGSIILPEGAELNDDDSVKISVDDTSLADAPSTVIGVQIYQGERAPSPLTFAVSYDPTFIQDNRTYTMRVRIEDAEGNLRFINDTSIPVITNGNPTTDVEVPVIAVN